MCFVVIIYLVHSKFQRTHHGRGTHNCFSCIVTHIFRYFYMESFHKDSAGGEIKKIKNFWQVLPPFLASPPPPDPCKVIWNPESRLPFNKRMFELVTPLLRGCLSKNRSLNFALSRISGFVYCVFLCGTNKLEPKKPDALAGYTEPVYSRPFSSLGTADVFFSTERRVYGSWDWLMK